MVKAFGFYLMLLTLLTMEKGWPVVSGHSQYDSAPRFNRMYNLRSARVLRSQCVQREGDAVHDYTYLSSRKRPHYPCLHLRGGSGDTHESMDNAGNTQLLKQTFSNWKDLMKSLMSSENEIRKEAEEKYEEIKTEMPDATCTALIQEIAQGESEESKTMAAVLARSTLSEVWEKLSTSTKEDLQSRLLDALKAESSAPFLRKVANVVGAISFSANDGKWPQLLPTLYEMCKHEDSNKKELGFYMLSLVLGHAGSDLMKFDEELHPLFESALQDRSCGVQVSGLKAISSFLSSCSTNKQMKPAQALLSRMLAAIGAAVQGDEYNARAGLDVLIEIVQVNPRFFKPQLKVLDRLASYTSHTCHAGDLLSHASAHHHEQEPRAGYSSSRPRVPRRACGEGASHDQVFGEPAQGHRSCVARSHCRGAGHKDRPRTMEPVTSHPTCGARTR